MMQPTVAKYRGLLTTDYSGKPWMRFSAHTPPNPQLEKCNMPKGNNRRGNREIRKPKKEKVKVPATANSAPKTIGLEAKSKTHKLKK